MNFSLFTLLALSLFALAAVAGADGRLQTLPHRGKQERAICSAPAEGKCLNRVVTCPAECPKKTVLKKSRRQTCVVDCSVACAATCKNIIHTLKPYQTWCNKTGNKKLCESVVRSDPRHSLKMSPQGLVVILMNAAQVKANTTRLFIYRSLKHGTADLKSDAKEVLRGCLLVYNLDWVKSSLSADIKLVRDKKRCVDVNDSLRNVMGEVTYDCESNLPRTMSPILNMMVEKVELFASIIDIARQILSLIGCGPI